MPRFFDYLVLGGGTAGAVVAARLAEDASKSVCLVEAGPSDEGRLDVARLQSWPTLLQSDLDWDYPVEPQPGRNSSIRGSRARVLGGCSSHNTGIFYPATDADLGRWEDAGAAGWGAEDCRPFYDRVLRRVGIEAAPSDGPAAAAFIEACRQLGYPGFTQLADAGKAGAGWTTINARWPDRRSSSVSYLHPLASLPANLTLMLETRVDKILLVNHVAVGAVTAAGTIMARCEIILCAGVFGSAQLLLLSGIGPAEHLGELEIDVIADLPVGRHLTDHPEGVVVYRAPQPVVHGRTMWVDAVLLANSQEPAMPEPELMIWFFSGDFAEITVHGGQSDLASSTFSMAPDVAHPRSEGWVQLRSADPTDTPQIQYNYFSDPDGYDERLMLEGIRISRTVAAQPPLRVWVDTEIAPGSDVVSDSELISYLRGSTYTAHHPAGTCRMGGEGDSVVDPRLRVRGVERLRVADASVFPRMIGLNLCCTVMMVAERCAELVREDSMAPMTSADGCPAEVK